MEDIKRRVRKYIGESMLMAAGAEEIADDASFLEHNLLDSTGVLEIVAFVEETFGIKIEDREIVPQNLDSLDGIAAFVERKRGAHDKAA